MLYDLREDQWKRIKDSLPGKVGDRGRSCVDNRKFIGAIMWIARTGSPWRALPKEYGKWSTVHKRFMRWAKAGVWQMIFNTLSVDEDTEWLMLDSTMIRAHQHAAGARKNIETGMQEQELGRSKGGFTTKLHAACDALGNPVRFFLTAGQRSDYTKARDLIEGKTMTHFIEHSPSDTLY